MNITAVARGALDQWKIETRHQDDAARVHKLIVDKVLNAPESNTDRIFVRLWEFPDWTDALSFSLNTQPEMEAIMAINVAILQHGKLWKPTTEVPFPKAICLYVNK